MPQSDSSLQRSPGAPGEAPCAGSFLPDFCSIRTVLTVVIVAELLAFVLLLGGWSGSTNAWERLGPSSLLIQWVALSSAAVLCGARPRLCRYGNVAAGVSSYALVLVVTVVLSEIAYRLVDALGLWRIDDSHLGFLVRNLAISAIFSAVALRFLYLQHRQRMHLQAQAEARIEALQARIRPHFLFNTMNTIASLIRSDPARAETVVEDLCDLFRSSLANAGERVGLEEELQSARHYLHIEQLRLGDRLQVNWQLDGLPQGAQLPPLTLQPLLENAIYHGIEHLPEGGTLSVRGWTEKGMVYLVLENPVPETAKPRPGHRLALENIRERLGFVFGRQAVVTLDRQPGRCRVELHFPVVEAPA